MRETRILATLVLAGYFTLGMVTRLTGEIFPVFSWFLYANVPQEQKHYRAFILQVKGAPLPAPLLFDDAVGILPRRGEVTAYRVMDDLGRAIETGRGDVSALRRSFESTYLPGVTRYKIVKISYWPLEYWKTKASTSTDIVTFDVEAP